jgi:nucleotide-binding universal stress UspA family protein
MNEQTVVVGYDGSPGSKLALTEAAREALADDRTLKIVHAYYWMPPLTPLAMPLDTALTGYREAAQQVVAEAAADLRSQYPDLKVVASAVEGQPANVLAAASAGADLLVVGSRGHGGFVGLLLGSVSMRVLASASCPVLVVRGEPRPSLDRVLAAVDIDGPCAQVVEFAFATASRHGAALTVLHVWDEPWFLASGGPGSAEDIAAVKADRAARLAAAVSPWQGRFPQVDVSQQIPVGSAGAVVVKESATADRLVVGGRPGRRPGLFDGPVTDTVLHHSACPVAVVPIEG